MSCPICGKPKVPAYRPFCSKRCADVDLSRWFNGTYTMPDEGDGAAVPSQPGADEDAGPER